jgi:hypothetical protein
MLAVGPAACATATPSPSTAAEPAEPIAVGDLAAGRYTNPAFMPRVEVTVPDGWVTFHLSRNFFDVAIETDEAPIVVSFLNPDAYLTPDGELDPASPEEAIAALQAHRTLSVSVPRPVEVDGIEGLEVDVAASVDNTHIMRTEEGDIGIGPTNAVRFAFFPVGDDVLVIGIIGPEGGIDETARLTEPVRESIRIGE